LIKADTPTVLEENSHASPSDQLKRTVAKGQKEGNCKRYINFEPAEFLVITEFGIKQNSTLSVVKTSLIVYRDIGYWNI
jgi:hypothetical protein